MPTWNTKARSERPGESCFWSGWTASSLAVIGGAHPPPLSQGGSGTPALPAGGHAADSLCPALLQSQRPGNGGPALRGRIGQEVRETQPVRGPTRRDHDPQLPSSLGAAGTGPGPVRGDINTHLESQGLRLREETIVDASIIEAPSSSKNRSGWAIAF